MAYSVLITCQMRQRDDAGRNAEFRMEPPWWPVDILVGDPRFVMSTESGCYVDYDADLSAAEFRELHERFRPLASRGVFQFDDWQKIIVPMLENLDRLLESSEPGSPGFHVRVFSWESGY